MSDNEQYRFGEEGELERVEVEDPSWRFHTHRSNFAWRY